MRRTARSVAFIALVWALAACGGGTPAGETTGPGGSLAADATPIRNLVVTETSDQTATYLLSKGQYKLAWSTTDCPNIDLVVTQTDGSFTFEKKATTKNGSTIIATMPDGRYKLEQKAPGCTTFKLNFDRIGNGSQ